MIRRRDLLRALDDYGLADWVVVERQQEVATADATLRRAERWLRWTLTVHHDSPTGRGSARVAIDAADGNANAAVLQAVTLARASIGNAWVTRPPAAPARVQMIDLGLTSDLLETAAALATVQSPAGATVDARATVLRENVRVVTRQGLRTEWLASHLRVEARVAAHDGLLVITREARRREDLAVAPAVTAAVDDLQLLASAKTVTPGPASVVLRTDALLHDGIGLWGVFVAQADAVVERMGLTRYRERSPVVPGADHGGADRLTITSNGALDFGVASAPVGDEGEPVRRFPLVERGIAVGLGLTPREGSLRGRDPNGGVRNLVVEPGTWTGAIDASSMRVIEIKRLRGLSLDPYTGDASAEILLGIEHSKGTSRPFSGGSLRIDAIAALARAKRSVEVVTRGPYSGPVAVLLEGSELFA